MPAMTARSKRDASKAAQTKPEAGKAGPEVTIEGQEPKATKPEPEPCLCGCGKPTVTAKARFIAGHDAKLKARLITAALEAEAQLGRMPTRDEDDSVGWAHVELRELGWTTSLERSRESRAKKAEAKATKATAQPKLTPQELHELLEFIDTFAPHDTDDDPEHVELMHSVATKLAAMMPTPPTETEEEAEQAS